MHLYFHAFIQLIQCIYVTQFITRRSALSGWLLLAVFVQPIYAQGQTQVQTSDSTPRIALVFGNAAYTAPDRALKNPVSDARLMARTLKELNFDVRLREDMDRRGMLQALRDFEDALRKTKGVGFLYFAGHGVQVSGRNYIVPIGANLVRDVDAQKNALDVDEILQRLRDTGARLNVMVLDACRNNPLLATSRAGGAGNGRAQPGLAPIRPPEGALVAFATEPGRLASDGKDSGNGLYTRHLARWIKEPNLTLEQVFKRTREAVQLESKGEQIPTEYSVLTGADLFLASVALPAPESAAQATNPPSVAPLPARNLPVSPGNKIGLQASRSVAVTAPANALDAATARQKLSQLGASFTRQSFQQALDNDDVLLFEALIAAGWKVEVQDIARLLDPRENRWDWPEKVMQSISRNAPGWPLHAQLCDQATMGRRFDNLPDVLARGYDSPALANVRILFERENLTRMLAPRRAFYQQLCNARTLAAQPAGK